MEDYTDEELVEMYYNSLKHMLFGKKCTYRYYQKLRRLVVNEIRHREVLRILWKNGQRYLMHKLYEEREGRIVV